LSVFLTGKSKELEEDGNKISLFFHTETLMKCSRKNESLRLGRIQRKFKDHSKITENSQYSSNIPRERRQRTMFPLPPFPDDLLERNIDCLPLCQAR